MEFGGEEGGGEPLTGAEGAEKKKHWGILSRDQNFPPPAEFCYKNK